MKFSIIVVTLNAGDKLIQTVESILAQTYTDFEIVVKDGQSKDGSVEKLPKDERIALYVERDKSIYDAMNQAVSKAKGDYVLFLNCGDLFYDDKVLERTAKRIDQEKSEAPMVLYGDTYGAKNSVYIASPKKIDGEACYRNIPCHQSCFYATQLCKDKPYDVQYRIRADYDHFLWCYYEAGARMVYLGETVSSYEGGGYSESKENRARDKEEHRLITEKYMSEKELAAYKRKMALTLAPLRSFLAENRWTSGVYHWLKDCVIHHKVRMLIGFLILFFELFLFFGTGIMGEEITHFHSGEGAYELTFSEENSTVQQTFRPTHENLELISFLVRMDGVTQKDGSVEVTIAQESGETVFGKTIGFDKLKDGAFTDVETNLLVQPHKKYETILTVTPSSAGEYPAVGICDKKYRLKENGRLFQTETEVNAQLVSRYRYTDAVEIKPTMLMGILCICFLTAFGIMFGLPKKKGIRQGVVIFLLLAAPWVLGSRLEMLTYKKVYYLPFALRWNVGILYGLELVLLLITQLPWLSVCLVSVAATVIYVANNYVLLYRGKPLHIHDFSAIGTVKEVVGDYEFQINGPLLIIGALLVLILVFALQTFVKSRKRTAKEWALRGASYVLTIALGMGCLLLGNYILIDTNFLEDYGFAYSEFPGFYLDDTYYVNGFLVSTCLDIRNTKIVPPDGYSKRQVTAVLEPMLEKGASRELSVEEQQALPHVILVLNESFSDLEVLGDLELNQEAMPFFKSLEDNTIRGYVNASVLGGGTANSEFEIFTGCTSAMLPVGYYPYQQGIFAPLPSMISQMKKYGYTTVSMHPELATNWNRDSVYTYLGFDQSYWKEDFQNPEMVHKRISDAATYEKIIDIYEQRQSGEKLFLFDLTMQNHGGYNLNNIPYEVKSVKMQNDMVDEYLSLIKISDEAFEDLVRYFEKQDEKVIICMLGDHQPWLADLIVEEETKNPDASMLMAKYKTPFVIWANYDIDEAEDYDISINYLGGLLQETAGIPLSPYFSYLRDLRENYPIITNNGYLDAQGQIYNWEGNDT